MAPKNKPREFYLITWCEPSYSDKRINDCDIHVVEYSAFQAAQDKIQQLEKQNKIIREALMEISKDFGTDFADGNTMVAKQAIEDAALRTYDDLVQRDEKLEAHNKILLNAVRYYANKRTWTNDTSCMEYMVIDESDLELIEEVIEGRDCSDWYGGKVARAALKEIGNG